MRGYAGLYIFCAVLTFVCSGASLAADGAAEYRAPVSGVKLGPVQPAQPEPPAAPGPPSVEKPAAPQLPGPQPGQSVDQQPNQQAGQQVAGPPPALQTAASGQPTPWPNAGGMAPYSSFGSLPGPADAPAPAPAPTAAPVPNPADVPPPAPAPGFAPEYAPGYGPGYAPYPAPAPGWQGQGDSFVSGTGQLQGENFNDRGIATQYRDPQTGDIVTSVVPPAPPDQQNYGTFFVAPQIYPDGNPWGANPYGPMPRPGGPCGRGSRTCLRLSGSPRRSQTITGIAMTTGGMTTDLMMIGAMTIGSMIIAGMMTGRTMAVTMARAASSMIRATVATTAPTGRATTAMTSGEMTGITRAPAIRAIHSMTRTALTGAVMEGRGVEHACRALGFSA